MRFFRLPIYGEKLRIFYFFVEIFRKTNDAGAGSGLLLPAVPGFRCVGQLKNEPHQFGMARDAVLRGHVPHVRADCAFFSARRRGVYRDDFEACIAHLRAPVNHRRAVRTTNLRERLFVEERRWMKSIAGAFGEKPVLKLMFADMIRASDRWRALRITGFERRQMDALRRELDQNYEAENDISQPSADMRPKKLSSIYRT